MVVKKDDPETRTRIKIRIRVRRVQGEVDLGIGKDVQGKKSKYVRDNLWLKLCTLLSFSFSANLLQFAHGLSKRPKTINQFTSNSRSKDRKRANSRDTRRRSRERKPEKERSPVKRRSPQPRRRSRSPIRP